MTFFSGLKISLEKYPVSERQNVVFPTIPNFIPECSPHTRFSASGHYHNNCEVLERSAEDRSDGSARGRRSSIERIDQVKPIDKWMGNE